MRHGVNSLKLGWQTAGLGEITGMTPLGSTMFVSTALIRSQYGVSVWEAAGGAEDLLGSGPASSGTSACCTFSDGTNLVWLEGTSSGWHPDLGQFDDVALMASPIAIHKNNLQPRKLRPA